MITLGVQYYRPPFPDIDYWKDDFERIAGSGLNTVQLWVLWGWVEPSPGEWIFDDYDRLMDLAAKNGLGVVLSAIAEIQPYWIHRQVPGSEMVDNMGHTVISSNRRECHFGLTPGGCTDHPAVWEKMREFFSQLVTRYRSAPQLRGWDAWNELRWNVNADGLVCYCPNTIDAFHGWLDERYGGLDGLNAAWRRRYRDWQDVLPGKMPGRTYTEMMAFEHFITWRSDQIARNRYNCIKSLDPTRPVTVHGALPTAMHGTDSYPTATALHRGNDWNFADWLDGIGCSSFPNWFHTDLADYSARIDFLSSAARGKRMWLSELQGGRAGSGDAVHQPVQPDSQQRWLWTGIGNGADTVLFWCWRDEVFGHESSGFGISGNDGYAEQRLAAMRKTGDLLRKHEALLAAYTPDTPEVGILFSPQSYYQDWAVNGSAAVSQEAIQGYARALIRQNIPYIVVEAEHPDALLDLRVLFMPRTQVVDQRLADTLVDFVKGGGTVVCEAECGAFDNNGFYRYPEDRFLAGLTGVVEIGRRALQGPSLAVTLKDRAYNLPVKQWLTPYHPGRGKVLTASGDPLVVDVAKGDGYVLLCGAYMGDAYFAGSSRSEVAYAPYCSDFEQFLDALVRQAGVVPPVDVLEPSEQGHANVRVKVGTSGGKRLCFVFMEDAQSARLRFQPGFFAAEVVDLVSSQTVTVAETAQGQECSLAAGDWGVAILSEK
jgi:beta-galactosidase